MTIATYKTKAWVTDSSHSTPQDLEKGDLSGVSYSNAQMESVGWTFIGNAEVTVELVDKNTLIDNKVSALRAEAANIRAEAAAKVTRIEGKIQQLLCIENNPSVA